MLFGIANKQMALNTLIAIPLTPWPSMIAPMYFGGNIPPSANVDDYTIPPKIPKTTRIEMQAAKALPASKAFVINGRASISTDMASYPPEILRLKEYLFP